jgi:hypothetical protein
MNGATTQFNLYRLGGGDTEVKLVATVKSDLSALIGASPYVFLVTLGSDIYIQDNTPDSYLISIPTTLQYGRDPAPSGCSRVAFHQGRLWLAKGSTLYGSWLLNSDNSAALYFNSSNDPSDPNGAIKGAQFSIGGDDNDDIQRLISFKQWLVVLKQRSIWIVSGWSADNFTAQSHLIKDGIGCIAPRAAGVYDNSVVFLGPDNWYQFDGDSVQPLSTIIERVLAPAQFGGAPLDTTAYKNCALLVAHKRAHLFAPETAGDDGNRVAYVHDSRYSEMSGGAGWTVWRQMDVTGGASLGYSSDSDEIFLAGLDGQIYRMTGFGDTSVTGGPVTPVTHTIASRGHGYNDPMHWAQKRATRLRYEVTAGEAVDLAATVTGDDGSLTLPSYRLPVGYFKPKSIHLGGIQGHYIAVQLTVSTAKKFIFHSCGIACAEGRDYT